VAWSRNEYFNMIIALNENDLDAINAVDKVSDKVRTTLYTVRGRGLIVHLNKVSFAYLLLDGALCTLKDVVQHL
jgi:hypothetical protein